MCFTEQAAVLPLHSINIQTSFRSNSGRAIPEVVSRWLPTAAVLSSRLGLASEICGGQSGVVAGFLRVLRFPLPKPFILPTSPLSQTPGTVNGRSAEWTQYGLHPQCPSKKKKKKKKKKEPVHGLNG
jgi:hypothetical protein